ncbi:MAG: ThiF family adenylyltransferase [Candidatus Heimdallarchaeota archaeon]|nr:ThiF family adenylyltransferase [Candidatus Heimdallarchaeota archaeon]
MWKLLINESLMKELTEFLFSSSPLENGCFLQGNSYRSLSGISNIIITKIIKPDSDSWEEQSENTLKPRSTYINQCAVKADTENTCLIFIHSHPNPLHPSKFSMIDELTNDRIFKNLSEILTEEPLGSLVLSNEGIYGIIFDGGEKHEVSNIITLGKTLKEFPIVGSEVKRHTSTPTYDRQEKVLGSDNQLKLQNMTAIIVGLGGTGSSVATQLARMGIKKLIFIDNDVIDDSNVSRVYGSTMSDIGKAKVDVVKEHIMSFSKTEVVAIKEDITRDCHLPEMIISDVIFSCTDNLSSRAVLNDIAIQYYIPLIDVGCRIHLTQDSEINQSIVKIQSVLPETACLWCTGVLDGKLILQESLPQDEKQKLAEEGYYENIEKQPSVISLTTLAASLGVQKLLNLIGVFGDDYGTQTQIELVNGFMIDITPEKKHNCICHKRDGLAAKRRIV